MSEIKLEREFLKEFLKEVEEGAVKAGNYEEPLLERMLPYMDRPDDPIVVSHVKEEEKTQVDAYSYNEEEQSLDLFITYYDYDQNEQQLATVSKTVLTEVANRAKRFFTRAKTLVGREVAHPEHELAKLIVSDAVVIDEVNIFILTNAFYHSNKPIDISIPGVESVNVQVWDIDRIHQLVMAEQGIQNIYIDFETEFNETFEMMFVPDPKQNGVKDHFDCYIGFIPAKLLAKAYDNWGPKLVERNVRSFLQARGGTNKGIRDTLKNTDERHMFVAYNNGISSVARAGELEQVSEGVNLFRVKKLTGWQIVNGGQTTASIHQAFKSGIELGDVYVQTKLTILKVQGQVEEKDKLIVEDEMVSRISEYANTQNKINKSDLLANTRFMSSIEQYSRSTWIPNADGRKSDSKWYFERARGQYLVDVNRRKRGKEQTEFKKQYPKEFVLSKVDLAKHYMSWEQYPYISSKGAEEAFKRFMELNKHYWKYENEKEGVTSPVEVNVKVYQQLIARTIISKNVANIVDKMRLKGYRANVIYYSTAMLSHLYNEQINLEGVWKAQNLSDKWDDIIYQIAKQAHEFLRSSAGDRNVTQWAKQEACWLKFKEECSKPLRNLAYLETLF